MLKAKDVIAETMNVPYPKELDSIWISITHALTRENLVSAE